MRALAASDEPGAARWRRRLALEPDELERWDTLSPGERKRWQLGAALAEGPDVLLLDEPTNHLDAAGRDLVVEALVLFEGVGLVVSHDRELLDALCERTVRVRGGGARLWRSGYSGAREAWRAEAREAAETLAASDRSLSRKQARLSDARRDRHQRAGQRARELRRAHPKDRDTRSVAAKGRFLTGAAGADKRLRVLRDEVRRAADARASLGLDKELEAAFRFDHEPCRRQVLLRHAGEVELGGDRRLTDLDLVVERGDRIHVAGPNGAGKSTLLAALVADHDLPADRLLHLPQELTAREAAEALDAVRALPRQERGRVLQLVAALGVEPERLLASAAPSPGEARKLVMARGLGLGAWCLVLDEPTNHLDLPAVERLEEALAAWPGALVLVTHDGRLAEAVTTRRWLVGEGGVQDR